MVNRHFDLGGNAEGHDANAEAPGRALRQERQRIEIYLG
jgi:hypothetical protein